VDVEGKQSGIDGELLDILAADSTLPCTYAGGIHTFEDITKIISAGKGKIGYTVGSALDIFGGKLPYAEIVKLNSNS
jgi:phosphoribosylformimino-5-aminoimidazole carboxamide ribotide isomerase